MSRDTFETLWTELQRLRRLTGECCLHCKPEVCTRPGRPTVQCGCDMTTHTTPSSLLEPYPKPKYYPDLKALPVLAGECIHCGR